LNILVLGKDGQVGSSLQDLMPEARFWGRDDLDLEDLPEIQPRLRRHRPDLLVNAAAFTAVDRAESESLRAQRVNCQAVRELAEYCSEHGIPLLHLSTDYVFDGAKNGAYSESDPASPQSIYGITKLGGERAIEAVCETYWIIRTSWVFSPVGSNFVKTMLRLGAERDQISVVDDQHGRPTCARDLANAIRQLMINWQSGAPLPWGTWHYANHGPTTWYGFAREIFAQAVKQGLLDHAPVLNAIPTDEFPTAAARPRNSVLDTRRFEEAAQLDIPHWRISLECTLRTLKSQD